MNDGKSFRLTLAFDAPEIHVAAPPAAVPAPPAPPRPPSVDGAGSEEESDDVVGVDEVMPAAKVGVDKVILCDWACDEPEMTSEEVELGYCSGRRCKAKMHATCFLRHAGEAGAALNEVTCFCQACWVKQC